MGKEGIKNMMHER